MNTIITTETNKDIIKAGPIPYQIVAIVTHTETMEEYAILRGTTVSSFKVLPISETLFTPPKEMSPKLLSKHIYGKKKIYQHAKNKRYYRPLISRVTDLQADTYQEFTIYESLYGEHRLWLRPQEMYAGKVEINGIKTDRFELIFDHSILVTVEESWY